MTIGLWPDDVTAADLAAAMKYRTKYANRNDPPWTPEDASAAAREHCDKDPEPGA